MIGWEILILYVAGVTAVCWKMSRLARANERATKRRERGRHYRVEKRANGVWHVYADGTSERITNGPPPAPRSANTLGRMPPAAAPVEIPGQIVRPAAAGGAWLVFWGDRLEFVEAFTTRSLAVKWAGLVGSHVVEWRPLLSDLPGGPV
jgi:hypothetical protein